MEYSTLLLHCIDETNLFYIKMKEERKKKKNNEQKNCNQQTRKQNMTFYMAFCRGQRHEQQREKLSVGEKYERNETK